MTPRLAIVFLVLVSSLAWAEELPLYRLVARDGAFDPLTIEVAAGKRFKIEISNEGKGPMEFESRDLKQEKVLAAGAKSVGRDQRAEAWHLCVLRRLSPRRAQGPHRSQMKRDADHG